MAAISWKSATSQNWTTAADWSTGAVPGSADDATISVAGTYQVTIDSADAAHSVTLNNKSATLAINSGGTLTLGTTLVNTAGIVQLNGGGTIEAAELFDADFAIKASPVPPARMTVSKIV